MSKGEMIDVQVRVAERPPFPGTMAGGGMNVGPDGEPKHEPGIWFPNGLTELSVTPRVFERLVREIASRESRIELTRLDTGEVFFSPDDPVDEVERYETDRERARDIMKRREVEEERVEHERLERLDAEARLAMWKAEAEERRRLAAEEREEVKRVLGEEDKRLAVEKKAREAELAAAGVVYRPPPAKRVQR